MDQALDLPQQKEGRARGRGRGRGRGRSAACQVLQEEPGDDLENEDAALLAEAKAEQRMEAPATSPKTKKQAEVADKPPRKRPAANIPAKDTSAKIPRKELASDKASVQVFLKTTLIP